MSLIKHEFPLLSFSGFPRKPLHLLWLTSVRSPSVPFLIAAHTGSQGNVYSWRCLETEAFGDFDEIKPVNIEDGPQAVGSIRLQIGAVSVFRRLRCYRVSSSVSKTESNRFSHLIEVIVLSDQLFQLRLNVEDPFGWKFKLHQRNSGFLKMFQKAYL